MFTPVEDISLLYVEDEPIIREGLRGFLERRFSKVWYAADGAEGLALYRGMRPDIVMTDIRMPVMDGICMSKAILADHNATRLIVTSAATESELLLEALNLGIHQYLVKPLEHNQLARVLQKSIEAIRLNRFTHHHTTTITSAYRTINEMLDEGEEPLERPEMSTDDYDQHLDRMVHKIMQRTDSEHQNHPTLLLMSLATEASDELQWRWYELDCHNRLTRYNCNDSSPSAFTQPHQKPELYYLNDQYQRPPDPLLHEVLERVEVCGASPHNLVWYRNGATIVCAVNYPKPITSLELSIIKGFAVQLHYLNKICFQQHETEEAFFYTIASLARAAEASDDDTGDHIVRVGQYCAALANELALPSHMAQKLVRHSQLHDIGKIHIAPQLLHKPGRLSDAERLIMKEHTIFGAKIIGTHPRLDTARKIALHHHEHWDGSGYPYGLQGEQIPLEARITCLADTYDALRSKRSYKQALAHAEANRIINQGDQITDPTHFDPQILAAFNRIHDRFDAIYGN